jgi:hypothetical protein
MTAAQRYEGGRSRGAETPEGFSAGTARRRFRFLVCREHSLGATLGATGANSLQGIRTSMNSWQERIRDHGRI